VQADRLAAIALALHAGDRPVLERDLDAGASVLHADGAVVALVGDGDHRGSVAATDARYAAIDELQFNFGQGPCVDADRAMKPVLEPDLELAVGLWPAFAPAAMKHGIRAVFSFPLRVGATRLGVMNLYRVRPGPLVREDVRDAVSIANVVTHVLLEVEADLRPGDIPARLLEVVDHRAHVHQATGMIAAQLNVDTATALTRLRAHAWSNDRTIDDTARDVVARRLRFDA
jgi:GAF domain-containing protein